MEYVPQSVWLVGLSGAGKSTVGPTLAERLGFRFVDLDREVEATAGEAIPEIFRAGGEDRFRRLEAEMTARWTRRTGIVVATGGGWMARSDLERRSPGRATVWLRVRPETAIHRLSENAQTDRPLLAVDDPQTRLTEILGQREAAYAEAEIVVDTDGLTPDQVADAVFAALMA